MSQWVTLALMCNGAGCGAEFPGRVGERLTALRQRAADLGWGHARNDDRCPVHAEAAQPGRVLAVVR